MKRFAGAAALAIAAHSGVALAQPVIIESPDGPRGRIERGGPDIERPGRTPGRMERDAQDERPDRPGRNPRGAESERPDPRERKAQQEQSQQREQAQRERQEEQNRRKAAEPQRPGAPGQPAQAEQPQRPGAPGQPSRSAQPQQPNNRPGATENARPGAPDATKPGASDTARPGAPAQNDSQPSGATAQRPGATQPGATQPNTAAQPPAPGAPAGQQAAGTQTGEPERRRIADTVRQRVERNEIRPVGNLGVSVSVGIELPSRVQLQPLPADIASIRPQYRDHRYTVSDREIVIVDPRSRRVVEVIARNGGGGGRGGDVYAVLEQRRDVRRWSRPGSVTFEQGVILPAGAPYHDLPVEIVERNPNWRGYQYVMTESDEIAIVEPRSRRIVEVVDQKTSQSASAGGASATTGGTANEPASAGNGDRRALVRILMDDARSGEIQGVEQLKGAVLSQEFTLRPIPAEASQQDQQLNGYHYALIGDDVLIVDPRSREIIEVIE
jgi:hypothetical protein